MDALGWTLLGGALAFFASFAILAVCIYLASKRENTCDICGADLRNKFSLFTRGGARMCPRCWDIENPREEQK